MRVNELPFKHVRMFTSAEATLNLLFIATHDIIPFHSPKNNMIYTFLKRKITFLLFSVSLV